MFIHISELLLQEQPPEVKCFKQPVLQHCTFTARHPAKGFPEILQTPEGSQRKPEAALSTLPVEQDRNQIRTHCFVPPIKVFMSLICRQGLMDCAVNSSLLPSYIDFLRLRPSVNPTAGKPIRKSKSVEKWDI